MSSKLFTWGLVFAFVALAAFALWEQFYGPCSWFRGSSITNVPARCIPELVHPEAP
jgi:hypothetical protein